MNIRVHPKNLRVEAGSLRDGVVFYWDEDLWQKRGLPNSRGAVPVYPAIGGACHACRWFDPECVVQPVEFVEVLVREI